MNRDVPRRIRAFPALTQAQRHEHGQNQEHHDHLGGEPRVRKWTLSLASRPPEGEQEDDEMPAQKAKPQDCEQKHLIAD